MHQAAYAHAHTSYPDSPNLYQDGWRRPRSDAWGG